MSVFLVVLVHICVCVLVCIIMYTNELSSFKMCVCVCVCARARPRNCVWACVCMSCVLEWYSALFTDCNIINIVKLFSPFDIQTDFHFKSHGIDFSSSYFSSVFENPGGKFHCTPVSLLFANVQNKSRTKDLSFRVWDIVYSRCVFKQYINGWCHQSKTCVCVHTVVSTKQIHIHTRTHSLTHTHTHTTKHHTQQTHIYIYPCIYIYIYIIVCMCQWIGFLVLF